MWNLAIVWLVLFAITYPLGLALFNLESHLFDQQIYKAALERMQPETGAADLIPKTQTAIYPGK